jgi:hypothetical protein
MRDMLADPSNDHEVPQLQEPGRNGCFTNARGFAFGTPAGLLAALPVRRHKV